MVLHALHENGQVETSDLEAHIKDDIEREGVKIAEMTRKVRQAYKEVVSVNVPVESESDLQATAPVIEDDMLFNEQGGMLAEYVTRPFFSMGTDYLAETLQMSLVRTTWASRSWVSTVNSVSPLSPFLLPSFMVVGAELRMRMLLGRCWTILNTDAQREGGRSRIPSASAVCPTQCCHSGYPRSRSSSRLLRCSR